VLKHFTISLLSKLQQQVRYEQVETFYEVVEVAKMKESMEKVP
jgi:hypothetical protein